MACTHLLCALIGDGCSLAVQRSRGCHATRWPSEATPEVIAEVSELLAAIDPAVRTTTGRAAAVRLAQLVRGEALEARNLIAQLRVRSRYDVRT